MRRVKQHWLSIVRNHQYRIEGENDLNLRILFLDKQMTLID